MGIFCRYADEKFNCHHPNRRAWWGYKPSPCNRPNNETRCPLWGAPPRPEPTPADPSFHGQCLDSEGNEWEITNVTEDDIVILVRGVDGRSVQTNIPKGPFLSRLQDQPFDPGD